MRIQLTVTESPRTQWPTCWQCGDVSHLRKDCW
jgi:hypothetical protein